MRAQLLPALSPGGAPRSDDRQRDEQYRFPLRLSRDAPNARSHGGLGLDHRKTLQVTAGSPEGQISVELSARRTGMSFQRTRMSADRTLMSVIRTSLSLIGFGFTIFQFFQKLKEAGNLTHPAAPR